MITNSIKFSIYLVSIFVAANLFFWHWQIVDQWWQLNYREGVMLVTTELLLKGENPYSIEVQPMAANVYGIGYHLFVYPFAYFFGNSLEIHRIISGLFIFLSCGWVGFLSHRNKIPFYGYFPACLILHSLLIENSTAIARPDSMGMFLFLTALYVPFLRDYDYKSLFISIFLTLIASFTKFYFILAIPLLALYIFLFQNKMKGIVYGCIGIAVIVLGFITAHFFMEAYIANVFGQVASSGKKYNWGYVFEQLIHIYFARIGVFSLLLFAVVGFLRHRNFPIQLKDIQKHINLKNLSSPFFDFEFSFDLFIFIVTSLLFILKMGHHRGSYVDYYYQLSIPFLLVFSLVQIKVLYSEKVKMWLFAIVGILCAQTYFLIPNIDFKTMTQNWEIAQSRIAQYKEVLNSPEITSILITQNKKVYDSGHSSIQNFPNYFKFDTSEKLKNHIQQNKQNIYEKIKNQEYNAITSTGNSWFSGVNYISKDTIKVYYVPTDTIKIQNLLNSAVSPIKSSSVIFTWELVIWEPKGK